MPPFEWIFHAAAFLALFWSAEGYPTQKFFATEPVRCRLHSSSQPVGPDPLRIPDCEFLTRDRRPGCLVDIASKDMAVDEQAV